MRLSYAITVFFLFAAAFLPAQTVLHTTHDTTAKKTGIKVSVLNPHGKAPVAYAGHAMHTDSVPDAIKINPGNLFRGDFPVYYEHRLSDAFSVEGAAGITYIDYLYEMYVNGNTFMGSNPSSSAYKYHSGFSGMLQLRWYPSPYETAITGYYIAPVFSYRQYKSDYLVFTGLIREPHRMNRTWTDLKIQFGYQDADPYDKIFWEFYGSVGVRHVDEDYLEQHYNDISFLHDNYWRGVIGGGVKVGFTL